MIRWTTLQFCILLGFIFLSINIIANQPEWDNTQKTDWPEGFNEIEILSSVDNTKQKSYFYQTKSNHPKPLIISLHTWSGDYTQKDLLVKQILANDWNYIHPNFRGPNNTKEACGSPLVVSDIDDAISFAIEQGNVDKNQIHIIGVSGGGYATLLAYMQSKYDIRTFSAWVPIADIHRWYYESKGRNAKYAQHIALATSGDSSKLNRLEAMQRSPMYMNTPISRRSNSKLFIYAGIHDGYTGSVPISHSLDMYNKIVKDFYPMAADELIPEETKNQLIVSRNNPGFPNVKLADRKIHFQKTFRDKLQITIFEGTHEMLTERAFSHIPSQTILTIGDSNGEAALGWPFQLQKLMFNDFIINTSISGNTIGFDNAGNEKLNTLKQIDGYLQQHDPTRNRVDKIIIMLGTNDCKAEYDRRLKEVPHNYARLLGKIKDYYATGIVPEIMMVSPPPYAHDSLLLPKYKGASKRVAILHQEFYQLSKKENIRYINTYSTLLPNFEAFTYDGVHLTTLGYEIIARLIMNE